MDILQMSLSASVMIVAVVMIRALTLHRLPKRTFLVLWGVVICRLLIPFSIPSRFSFYTGIDRLNRMFAENKIAPSASGVIMSGANTANIAAAGETIGTGAPTATAAAFVSPIEIAWFAGICICSVLFIVAYIKCRREFRTSLPVDNVFISYWLRGNTLRRIVQIRQSDRIQAPLTYGVFRPVILLPKTIDWTDEAGLKVILTHEMTHIRRFDTLTKLVLAVAVCVHWFNPFVWVMYVVANRDIELACDESVVRTFGEPMKSAYAMTLIALEEKKSAFAPLISGFSKNAIEERITAIMKIKRFSIPIIIVAVLLVGGITVGFATSNAKANDDAAAEGNAEMPSDALPSPDSTESDAVGENSYLIDALRGNANFQNSGIEIKELNEPVKIDQATAIANAKASVGETISTQAENITAVLVAFTQNTPINPDSVTYLKDYPTWIVTFQGVTLLKNGPGKTSDSPTVFADENVVIDANSGEVLESFAYTSNSENQETTSNTTWVWPVEGYDTVTAPYGSRIHPITHTTVFHDHIDIGAKEGSPVYTALTGTVSETGFDDEWGNYIVINHDNGIETFYQHLSELQVSAGDPVAAGNAIGTVGSTGNATGPHLAFGVRIDGNTVDPMDYLK